MTFGAIEADSVDHRLSGRGINDLTNSKQGRPSRDREQVGVVCVGRRGVAFFVGVRQFHSVVVLQRSEQRAFPERGRNELSELWSRQIAGLEREGFFASKPQPIDFYQTAGRWQG